MICKNAYVKSFSKNGQPMIFCSCLNKNNQEGLQICTFQRYCNLHEEYILEKPERCRFYVKNDEE